MTSKRLVIVKSLILGVALLFWGITPASAFSGGDGTSGNPYQISTCADFTEINTALSAYHVLTTNLDCTASGADIMVGKGSPFTGDFDGQGNIITVAITSTTNNNGLFASTLGATISNVRVAGTISSSAAVTGGVVGYLGSASILQRVVNNASISVSAQNAGGIAGVIDSATVRDSYNTGNVTSSGNNYYVGGIAGTISGVSVLERSYNRGIVTGSYHVGGLIGWRGNTATLIRYNFNVGKVLASQSTFFFGGILGNDVFSSSSNLAEGYTENYYDISRSTRSMCGYANDGSMISSTAGQCRGINANWTAVNYLKNSSTNPPFDNWDFDTVWDTVEGGYPALTVIANDDTVVNDEPTVPTAPQAFTVTNTAASSIQLSWGVPADTGGIPLTRYDLKYKLQSASEWTTVVLESWQTNHTLSGLTPGTAYDLSIEAVNAIGGSTAANTTATTTEMLAAPTDFTVTENGTNTLSVNFSWQAPAGSPMGYYVFYKVSGTSWEDGFYDVYIDNATSYDGFFGNLLPETTYVFRVAAVDSNWEYGAYSAEVTYTIPAAPVLLVGTCQELQDAATAAGAEDENYVATVRFENDIDCSDTVNWNEGSGFIPFSSFGGIIDGQGYKLINLTINLPGDYNVGLVSSFDQNGGVRDLEIVGADITGGGYVGILAGDTHDEVNGIFENITVTESIVTGSDSSTGGLIGRVDEDSNFTFSNISVSATIIGEYRVGGIVGRLDDVDTVSFDNVTFSGEVVGLAEDQESFGGIIGYVDAYELDLTDITVSGSVEGTYSVGGVIGELSYVESFSLSDTLVSADVSGLESVGGVIGYADSYAEISYTTVTGDVSAETFRAGGIIGYAYDALLYKCTNSGSVSGTYRVGGLVGSANEIEIDQSTNTGNISASFEGDSYLGDFKGVGGLVGISWNIDITSSRNTGTISGTGPVYVGGIAGACGTCFVNQTLNAGVINGNIVYHDYNGVGGLIGAFIEGHISNSMNHGAVNGKVNVGGISGYGAIVDIHNSYNSGAINGETAMGEGGIVGAVFTATPMLDGTEVSIVNTFNVGEVTSSSEAYRSGGGVLGGAANDTSLTLSNNWWANALENGIGNTALTQYGEALSPPETEKADEIEGQYQKVGEKALFKNTSAIEPLTQWDFEEIWMTEENEYPKLVSILVTPTPTPTGTATPTPTSTPKPTSTSAPVSTPTATPLPTGEVKILLNDFEEYLNGIGKEVLSLTVGQVVYFIHEDEEHSATVKEIGTGYVVIIVASTPQEVRLDVGATKEIDVNEDGTNDVRITLNSITDGKADLLFVQLSEPTTSVTPPVTSVVPEKNTSSKGNSLGWWLFIVGVLLFFIVLFKKRKRHEK